jgi:hypothetical protein
MRAGEAGAIDRRAAKRRIALRQSALRADARITLNRTARQRKSSVLIEPQQDGAVAIC